MSTLPRFQVPEDADGVRELGLVGGLQVAQRDPDRPGQLDVAAGTPDRRRDDAGVEAVASVAVLGVIEDLK